MKYNHVVINFCSKIKDDFLFEFNLKNLNSLEYFFIVDIWTGYKLSHPATVGEFEIRRRNLERHAQSSVCAV